MSSQDATKCDHSILSREAKEDGSELSDDGNTDHNAFGA
jgi:hypothetical protein